MPIEETLNQKFKEALRAKDSKTLDVIRMVRTEYKKAMTAEGYKGEGGEELWAEVIQSYVKKLRKAVPEYEEAGDRGREMIEKLNFEIEFLGPFMPPLLDETATEALVKETIEKVSATSPKMVGKVVGAIMKEHKRSVDPALVKKIAERLLGAGS
jgi:uncharacterized protein YqeY